MEIVSASRAQGVGSVGFVRFLGATKATLLAACFVLMAIGVSLFAGCNGVVTTAPNASNGTGTGNSTAPLITTQPTSQTVAVGQSASFVVVATGGAPLSYQWQKNGVNIAGATSSSYTTPAA